MSFVSGRIKGGKRMVDLTEIATQIKQGASELLAVAQLKAGDVFVVGCSTSEIQGEHIGQDSSREVGRGSR